MADKKPTVKKKVRAEKYDPKVKFEGTLEQMIAIAVRPKNKYGDNGALIDGDKDR